MSWLKNHIKLLFGLLAGLFLALVGFQKLSKKAAGVVDIEVANTKDRDIVKRERAKRRVALEAVKEAEERARFHRLRAIKFAKRMHDQEVLIASEVSDEEALKEINRD